MLLSFNNVSVSVSSLPLLDSVSLVLSPGQHVALVGPNGCGKSSLLSLIGAREDCHATVTGGSIDGELSPENREAGSVILVDQDVLDWAGLLPGAFELGASVDPLSMTVEELLDAAIAGGDEAAIDDAESWRQLLVAASDTLGWATADYEHTAVGDLSPGCALRAYLAVALRRQSVRLLLLDEPTNHLDLPTIMWLQATVEASDKTIIVVSHDEAFLHAVADHVWAIDPTDSSLVVSGARYSSFVHARQLAREQQRAAYDQQQQRREKLSAVANKLRDASSAGARHVASDRDKLQRDFRRDRAGRSGKKAKSVEKLRDSETTVDRVVDRDPLRIVLPPVTAGDASSILVNNVTLGYPGRPPLPLPPLTLRVDFGERIAIVGGNGVGKSTFVRTATGGQPPASGTVSVGRDLRLGHLRQAHESLPRDVTVRAHLAAVSSLSPFQAGVKLLHYGLARQQLDRPIGDLNPGARARVLLATFSLSATNALILDEPTNHLDVEAIAEVTASLNTYGGTLIVVSHDRAFLASLSLSKIFILTPAGLTEVPSIDQVVERAAEAVDRVMEEVGAL